MVVFVIAHCRNLQNIAPHRATAAEALNSISAEVILKTSDANYHFRVKNGRDYQNDGVAPILLKLQANNIVLCAINHCM